MSEHNPPPFRSPEQEVEHLNRQLGEIKEALREISFRVGLIERHVKRAFGILAADGGRRTDRPGRAGAMLEAPSLTEAQAQELFDELRQMRRAESLESVKARLEELGAPDLRLVAQEVGLTFATKPSRKRLVQGILGRLNESRLLSTNLNATSALAEASPAIAAASPPAPETFPPVVEGENQGISAPRAFSDSQTLEVIEAENHGTSAPEDARGSVGPGAGEGTHEVSLEGALAAGEEGSAEGTGREDGPREAQAAEPAEVNAQERPVRPPEEAASPGPGEEGMERGADSERNPT